MIAVIQRVTEASVAVDGQVIGACGKGFLILLGAHRDDGEEDARLLADKIGKLRIFSDENGKMNKALADVQGQVLVISQFTLLANTSHGNRPDFFAAAEPVRAKALYEFFVSLMKERTPDGHVETGEFGADMAVRLVNDGPVTIILNSDDLKKKKKEESRC